MQGSDRSGGVFYVENTNVNGTSPYTVVSFDLVYIAVYIKYCSRMLIKLISFSSSFDPPPHPFHTIDQMNINNTNSPQIFSTISATKAVKLRSFEE